MAQQPIETRVFTYLKDEETLFPDGKNLAEQLYIVDRQDKESNDIHKIVVEVSYPYVLVTLLEEDGNGKDEEFKDIPKEVINLYNKVIQVIEELVD